MDSFGFPIPWLIKGKRNFFPDFWAILRRPLSFGALAVLFTAPAAFAATATTTSLGVTAGGSAATSVASGTVVTLTATVTAGSTPVMPGTVNFCDATAAYCGDIHLIGTAQLTAAGTAVVRFRPRMGMHRYKAVFVGTEAYGTSSSAASALTVGAALYPTSTTLSASVNEGTGTVGGQAWVSSLANHLAHAPTGTVSFVDTAHSNALVGMASLQPEATRFALVRAGSGLPTSNTCQAAGDFNEDGIPDLALCGPLVYLGNGDGSFTKVGQTFDEWSQASVVTAADFNNDGHLDLLVGLPIVSGNGSAPEFWLLLGKGDGTFSTVKQMMLTANPGLTLTGDFNGDGNIDIAFIAGNSLTILLGNGDGTFAAPTTPMPTCSVSGLGVGDFNQDGRTDLAVTCGQSAGEVTVLLGHSDGSFATVSQSPTVAPTSPGFLVADVNGDGKPDLLVGTATSVSALLGNGDGTFAQGAFIAAPNANDLWLGDFNGDGILDFGYATEQPVAGLLYYGVGDGTFNTDNVPLPTPVPVTGCPLIPNAIQDVVAADFNGDGISDMSWALGVSSSCNAASTSYQPIVELAEYQNTSVAIPSFSLAPGQSHSIVAQYPGDNHHLANSSAATDLQYKVQTNLFLTSSAATVAQGQPVTFTATLAPYTIDGSSTDGETIGFTFSGSNRQYSPQAEISFGDSITYGDNASSPTAGYVDRIAQALNIPISSIHNYAIEGSRACDMDARQIFLNDAPAPGVNQPLRTLMIGINDSEGDPTGSYSKVFPACHNAGLLWEAITSQFKVAGSTATTTGTCSVDNTLTAAPGVLCTSKGSTAALGITTSGGPLYMWYRVLDFDTGRFSCTVDGNPIGNFSSELEPYTYNSGLGKPYSSDGTGTNDNGVFVVRVPVSAGAHILVCTQLSSGNMGITAIGTTPAGVPSSEYPHVIVGQISPRYEPACSNPAWISQYESWVEANVAQAKADGLNVDLAPTESYLHMTAEAGDASDCKHPNDLGMYELAAAFLASYQAAGAEQATATLSGGKASVTVSSFAGSYATVTASYAGDTGFQASTSAPISIAVSRVTPSLDLTTSSSAVALGQPVMLTATMTGGYSSSLAGEAITFESNGTQIGASALNSSGVATLQWTPTAAGPLTIAARYSGDSYNFPVSADSLLNVLNTGHAATTVTLTINGSGGTNSVAVGSTVTLSVTVMIGGNPVTAGTVRFCDLAQPTVICNGLANQPSAQLNGGGQAAVTLKPGLGTHNFLAVFVGTSAASPGVSPAMALTVTSDSPAHTTRVQFSYLDVMTGLNPQAVVNARLSVQAPINAPMPTGAIAIVDKSDSNKVVGAGSLELSSTPNAGVFQGYAGSTKTNSTAFAMASADFNHDGMRDLAIPNSGNDTVSILLGKGDGTFQPQATYATGVGAYAVAVGDFNADGNPDLAIANFSANTVSILLGKADGTFQTKQDYATGGGPDAVAVGDFNGDGKLDVAVVNNLDNTVSILLGKGDGTFSAQETYAVGATPDAIVSADFNGNGVADLAVANKGDSTISVLLSNSDGTFQTQVTYPTGAGPIAMVVADFNGDNKADLAVADSVDGSIEVFTGTGDGTFGAATIVGDIASVTALATGDLGTAGNADLIAVNGTGVMVLLNNGAGTFQSASTPFQSGSSLPTSMGAVVVDDWNGDGRADIALLDSEDGYFNTWLNASSSTWEIEGDFSAPPFGMHQYVLEYPGDSLYKASTSASQSLTNSYDSDTLTLTSSRNPANYGDSITLTASLNPNSYTGMHGQPSYATDGESIQFLTGSTVLGTGTLSSGVATLTLSNLPTGSDSLSVVYTTDNVFQSATGTMSQTVQPTDLTIKAEDATRAYGSANPALTVKVTGAANGDTFTATASTTATQISAAGKYEIVPSISGANLSDYNVVKVNGTLTITPATPTIELKSSAAEAFTNTEITFSATVSSSAGSPSGTVTFYDGSTQLNQATLISGLATYATSSLALGAHTITAVYSGDNNFVNVTSSEVTESIEQFTIATAGGSSTTATVSAGGTATYNLNVAPPDGTTFATAITFSVSGAPSGSTSTFTPASIAAGSGATAVMLKVTVPSSAAAQPPPELFGSRALPLALGLIAVPWLLPLRRRARRWFLAVCLATAGFVSAGAFSGCGGGSSGGATGGGGGGGGGGTPQNYTLTVSATSGSLVQTTKLTLTVE